MDTLTLRKDIDRIRATFDHNRKAMVNASKRHLVRWYWCVYREHVLDDEDSRKKADAILKEFCFLQNESPFETGETFGKLEGFPLCECLKNDVSTNWIYDQKVIDDYYRTCYQRPADVLYLDDWLERNWRRPNDETYLERWNDHSEIWDATPLLMEAIERPIYPSEVAMQRREVEAIAGKPVKFGLMACRSERTPAKVLVPFYSDGTVGNSRHYSLPSLYSINPREAIQVDYEHSAEGWLEFCDGGRFSTY